MLRHAIIKPIVAAFLLAVFTCGITPRKTLHDLVAAHKDTIRGWGSAHTDQLSTAGLNCKCDNLVVESAFLHIPVNTCTHFLPVHILKQGVAKVSLHASFHWYTTLRGPPVFC